MCPCLWAWHCLPTPCLTMGTATHPVPHPQHPNPREEAEPPSPNTPKHPHPPLTHPNPATPPKGLLQPLTCGQQLGQAGVGHSQVWRYGGSWQPLRLGAASLCLRPPAPARGWPFWGGKPGAARCGVGQVLGGSWARVLWGHHVYSIAYAWGVLGKAWCGEWGRRVGKE